MVDRLQRVTSHTNEILHQALHAEGGYSPTPQFTGGKKVLDKRGMLPYPDELTTSVSLGLHCVLRENQRGAHLGHHCEVYVSQRFLAIEATLGSDLF